MMRKNTRIAVATALIILAQGSTVMADDASTAGTPKSVVANNSVKQAQVATNNQSAGKIIQHIRFNQTIDKIRIVLDVTALPTLKAAYSEDNQKFIIEMPGVTNKSGLPQVLFNDQVASGIRFTEDEPGKLKAVVDLKMRTECRVFTVPAPNRIVIDISKLFDQKTEEQIAPGIKYTFWRRGLSFGPVTSYIVDIDPKAGYTLKPALSNDLVPGLETLMPMYQKFGGIVGVNGSYFSKTGEILGLLKMNGEIVSTPAMPHSAWGLYPDGRSVIDMIEYQGVVDLPDGQCLTLSGVNRERGQDEIVLYNQYYGTGTGSNNYGVEYTIVDGKVSAINENGNSSIPQGGIVLSAHGESAKKLCSLAIGDDIKVTQTLGPEWDKTVSALSAGPMLVKNGKVFLTTKIEEFGSDVAGGRAPRTSMGITNDGHILLVVVDGRQPHSAGLSLLELATFMSELGARDALNLDGGGSSEMILNGKIMNKPSDGRERSVGDAIIVTPAELDN